MKQLCLFIILIILFCSFTSNAITENSKETLSTKIDSTNIHPPAAIQPPRKYLNGNIFWEGWVKYFHFFTGISTDRPTDFFINNDYFSQKVQVTHRTKKDKHGYYYIPTKFNFYMVILSDRILILSSREKDITKASDKLTIEFINPIKKGKKLRGPIKDMGKFREGHCISIMATVPDKPDVKFTSKSGVSENWVICLSSIKEQEKLLKILVQLRLEFQSIEEEAKKEASHAKNAVSISDALTPKPTANIEMQPGASLKDGYLILLKDWSQCTLKCGGGWSYQQWMCIPPKEGGKPCIGDLIRKKPCNNNPCPGTKYATPISLTISPKIKQVPGEVLKPIIKSLPISTRPQQFLTCVIKESDVLLNELRPESLVREKYPARLIMNKRSISLFKDDKLSQAVFNYPLDKTEIYPDDNELCCFKIASDNKKYEICSFGQDCGDETNRKFVNEWERDFRLFKTRCFEPLKKDLAEKSVGKGPKYDGENILGSMGLSSDESNARGSLLKKKIEERAEAQFEAQLGKTQQVAIQAVKKEIGIEEMLKREFALKQKSEVDKLLKVMRLEKKKKASLEKALSDRQIEDAKLRASKEQINAIKLLQKDAQQEVLNKRNNLRKKMFEIKQKSDRKKRVIEQQINVIRGQMTNELMNANKKGSKEICRNSFGNKEKVNHYCNNHVIDDFNKNQECKDGQSFCYICCENEFGNMHILERDECYDMCDKLLAKQLDVGEFIWA